MGVKINNGILGILACQFFCKSGICKDILNKRFSALSPDLKLRLLFKIGCLKGGKIYIINHEVFSPTVMLMKLNFAKISYYYSQQAAMAVNL